MPLLNEFGRDGRASELNTFGLLLRECPLRRFSNIDQALVRQSGHQRNDGISHWAGGVERRFCVGAKAYVVLPQLLQMLERWQHSFPAEAVERPEDEHIEATLVGGLQHRLKSRSLVSTTRFLIEELLHEL